MWSTLNSTAADGSPAPCGRGKHTATLLDGFVYVLGGRGTGPKLPLRDLWRYSLATSKWERLPCVGDAPPALEQHSCVAHEGKLYVFGGEVAPSTETPLWIYDTQITGILSGVWRKVAGTWSPQRRGARGAAPGPPAPRPRRGHLAFPLQDCMLIYGGYMDLKGSTNELWAFHYESERWQLVQTRGAAGAGGGAGGAARHLAAGCARGSRLYVHGGRTDLRLRGDVQHYDTLSRTWTVVRGGGRNVPAPAPRCGHAGVRAGAHFYIFGGQTDAAAVTDDLWRFHFESECWERIEVSAPSPAPRTDCALLLYSHSGHSGAGAGGDGAGKGADNGHANGHQRSYTKRPTSLINPSTHAEPDISDAYVRPTSVRHSVHETRPDPPNSLLKEISKLQSSFNIRRPNRCSYTALPTDQDSTESLCDEEGVLGELVGVDLGRTRAGGVNRRPPGSQALTPGAPPPNRLELSRGLISVPNFRDMIVATPVLSPAQASRLVFLEPDDPSLQDGVHEPLHSGTPHDSYEQSFETPSSLDTGQNWKDTPNDENSYNGFNKTQNGFNKTQNGFNKTQNGFPNKQNGFTDIQNENNINCTNGKTNYNGSKNDGMVVVLPKSASVRFSKDLTTTLEDEGDSDYASAERVNRLSVISGTSLGFCNPHYLGGDVRKLSALTPDSGVSPGDMELTDLGRDKARTKRRTCIKGQTARLHILVVGGKEQAHLALLQKPLPMWTYRLL